jgi:hypothetical protein
MKKAVLALMFIAILSACGQGGNNAQTTTATVLSDPDVVNVYYFHGKQRCKTCIAVGDVAKQTLEKAFADNANVRFVEINTSEKGNEALIEKYEVTWNALIIAKGENAVEITKQAFATAVENPQALENLIKETITNCELKITN